MGTLRHRMTETQARGLEEMSSLGRELLILQSPAAGAEHLKDVSREASNIDYTL